MGETVAQADDEWRDKLAIQETMYRYSDALNRADWAAFEAVFAPDAVWEMHGPRDRRYEGAAAIAGNISRLVANVDMMYIARR
jgi:ketosteroid isomerase-like protein